VKFLVDAQLPAVLAQLLAQAGHDSIHTSGLPNGNRSTDREIAEFADAAGRVVITKDRDFRDSHLLVGSPQRLLVIATGNIRNVDLVALIDANLGAIVSALDEARYIELGTESLIVHRSQD
jgi:predicted nuclease of predicted toxin-antitoxin system